MLELVAVYLVGAFMGYVLAKVLTRPKSIGVIRIDRSDPDGPYLFLELDEPIHTFAHKKYVCVEIKNVDFLPRN